MDCDGLFVGIDVGLTATKVMAVDERGASRGTLTRRTPLSGVYIDCDVLWDNVLAMLRDLPSAINASGPEAILGIAVSSQGETFVPVNETHSPIASASTGLDPSGAVTMGDIARCGLSDMEFFDLTGHAPFPVATLPKLLRMKEREPHTFRQAHRFLCMEDYIGARLTGECVISPSLAARTIMSDIRRRDWAAPIMERFGLHSGMFSRILPSGSSVGPVDDHLGIGAPMIFVGGHDQPCGAYGVGAITPGTAVNSSGTVECYTIVLPSYRPTRTMMHTNHPVYPHVVPDRYVTISYTLSGGEAVRHFIETTHGYEGPYDSIIPDRPSEDLVFVPNATGNPEFHPDPDSGGFIRGDAPPVRYDSAGEIPLEEGSRAVIEGLAFESRYNLGLLRSDGVDISSVICVGGGSRSVTWTRAKADILGIPVVTSPINDASAYGAALLARKGFLGIDPPVYDGSSTLHEPDLFLHGLYDPLYSTYRAARSVFKGRGL